MTVLTILYAVESDPKFGGAYVHAQIGDVTQRKPALIFDTGGPTEQVVATCEKLWNGITMANEALGVFESVRAAVVLAAALENDPDALLLVRGLSEMLTAQDNVDVESQDMSIQVN